MNGWVRRRQDGQALVQVAVAMVVLLGFVSLAIDVGHLYAERRRMQNAADAGALAGAHELCFGTAANAEAKALEYTTVRNGAEEADVSIQEWEVGVVARETVELWLASIFVPDIEIKAEAAAACKAATRACEVWPIGFSMDRWPGHQACGTKFFLWDSSDQQACANWYCNVYCDNVNFFMPLDQRAWIDFTAVLDDGEPDPCDEPGCGEKELIWRMWGCRKNKWSDPCLPGNQCRSVINIPSCAQGDAGVKNPAWFTADNMAGEIVRFPLYDGEAGSCNVQEPCEGQGCCGNPDLGYDLSRLGCVRILGTTRLCKQDKACKAPPGCSNGPKVILVEIPCDPFGQPPPECSTACGRTGNDPPLPGDVRAVSLIK